MGLIKQDERILGRKKERNLRKRFRSENAIQKSESDVLIVIFLFKHMPKHIVVITGFSHTFYYLAQTQFLDLHYVNFNEYHGILLSKLSQNICPKSGFGHSNRWQCHVLSNMCNCIISCEHVLKKIPQFYHSKCTMKHVLHMYYEYPHILDMHHDILKHLPWSKYFWICIMTIPQYYRGIL